MDKYQFKKNELESIENSSIPFAIYQFVDKRVYAIAISNGLKELLDVDTFEEAYDLMTNNMYRDIHPDDSARVAKAALDFATNDAVYDVVYRQIRGGVYRIIHSKGKHIYRDGARLAEVSYTDEGIYDGTIGSESYFIQLEENYFQDRYAEYAIGYDYLTGLPDMNYFFELAQAYHDKSVKKGVLLAMIFMNLNGMQGFNQSYGYAEGNNLIKAIADLLAERFNRENCCRTTADHFAVFTELEGLDDRLNTLIEDLKHVNNDNSLPVSIGVYASDFERVSSAIATDRAKLACDNCGSVFESKVLYFDKNMLNDFQARRYVFENFEKAIQEGWIKVFYQPIVRTANEKVCNEEALVRWIDPKSGLYAPDNFIPILEDVKAAYKLDLLVVEEVLKKLKKQTEGGLYVVPNSVNLSRTDFYACDIVEEVRKRVDASGIDRSNLIIEITESVIMEDVNFMMRQVERFRELGFSVWLDDFGSGYSSPDILQKIDFDVVKIDKTFIDSIETSEDSRVIITELLRLSNGLGCETVAEGVENKAQVDFLNEIGCTRIQGFYYCKPIPLEDIFERYEKGEQIGFENPNEALYYETLGNVNLYDMSFSSDEDEVGLNDYFDTIPMFILEIDNDNVRLARGNKSYREFMSSHYQELSKAKAEDFAVLRKYLSKEFFNAIFKCKEDGRTSFVETRNKNNGVVQLLIRKIATNPENGIVALAINILAYNEDDAEYRHKEAIKRINQERKTYNRITALTGDFVCIYTVDPINGFYIQHLLKAQYKDMALSEKGENFFEHAIARCNENIFAPDLDKFYSSFSKENIVAEIKKNDIYSLTVRFTTDKGSRYCSIRAAMLKENDGEHLIVGIIDIDEQVRKEKEYSDELNEAKLVANKDTLTGVKNKHAYVDAETYINGRIEDGDELKFAITVFDLNGLKEINDTKGHQAGDEFIKDGCNLICDTFKHSPVYRIGGDEFVVISQGEDYNNIDDLIKLIEVNNAMNVSLGKVVVAVGMSRYDNDRNVAAVFSRADKYMYENKKMLKEEL